jgi:plastocyanin
MNATVRPIRWLSVLALATLFALMPLVGIRLAFAEEQPVKISVKVGESGFEPGTIEVSSGQLVEITFIWDSPNRPNEEHIIVFEGMKLESEKITKDHPQTTVKFVATTPGTFGFKCDIECDLHDALQKGILKVKAGGGTAAALQPSTLSVSPTGVAVKAETVKVSATLTDKEGQPIPRVEVTFYTPKTFLGNEGLVEIGVGKTAPNGQVNLTYRPTTTEARKIVVRFEGGGVYDATETTVDVPGSRLFGLAKAETHVSLQGLRDWAPFGFLGIILSIWAAFAFMLFQAWSVRRVRPGR